MWRRKITQNEGGGTEENTGGWKKNRRFNKTQKCRNWKTKSIATQAWKTKTDKPGVENTPQESGGKAREEEEGQGKLGNT